MQFASRFSDLEILNPEFTRAKCYVMYTQENRNNSYISKETVEAALPTMKNIPIIGEFKEDLDTFGSHGGKIVISDDGIEYVQTTRPYGVVSSDATFSWETLDDGHEYLVVDGCILWTSRYEEASKVTDDSMAQSMEISINNYFTRNDKVIEITDMTFSALCILGTAEPCFENSHFVESYSLNVNESKFTEEFSEMLKELAKYTLSNNEKNKDKEEMRLNMTKKIQKTPSVEPSNEFKLTNQQLADELSMILRNEEMVEDYWWDMPRYWYIDNFDNVVIAQDYQNSYVVGFEFAVNSDKVSIDFDTGKRYKIDWNPMQVDGPDADDNANNNTDGDEFSFVSKEAFEYVKEMMNQFKKNTDDNNNGSGDDNNNQDDKDDNKSNHQVIDSNSDNVDLGNGNQQGNNDTNSPDPDKLIPSEGEYELKRIEELEAENAQLREFVAQKEQEEKQRKLEDLLAKYSVQLSENEIGEIRTQAEQFSIEEIETKILATIGAKVANGQFSLQSNNFARVPVFNDDNKDVHRGNEKPYAHIIDKFSNKQ